MSQITPAEVKAARDAAAPGPWFFNHSTIYTSPHESSISVCVSAGTRDRLEASNNARFISMAHGMADLIEAQAEEIERLRKRVEAADRLAGWVEGFIEDGCPKCGGDCSAANPPVAYCPIADAMADLAAYRATEGEA